MSELHTSEDALPDSPYLQGLKDALKAVIHAAPSPNCELRYDGSEDPRIAEWVEGWHEAWAALNDLVIQADHRIRNGESR
jgi:hypothetical protein